MALITMPVTPTPAQIKWSLRQPTQVNRSEFTGRRKVTILAGAPRWSAEVALPTLLGEVRVRPWRAFLAACQGQANSFRLVACEGSQLAGNPTVLVKGAGQTGYSLVTDGWGAEGLPAGSFVTVGDQLLQLTAAAVPAAGTATLAVMPYLLAAPADNLRVEVLRPYAVMCLAQDENGWTAGKGQQYAISFACEEAR